MEGNTPLNGTGTEAVAFPGEGEDTPPESDGEIDASGEAQPEQAASPETGSTSAKTRRTTRKKKEEPSAETGGDAQKEETEPA